MTLHITPSAVFVLIPLFLFKKRSLETWSLPILVMGFQWLFGGGYLWMMLFHRTLPRNSQAQGFFAHATNLEIHLGNKPTHDPQTPLVTWKIHQKMQKMITQNTRWCKWLKTSLHISTHPSQYCFANEKPMPANLFLLWQGPPWNIQFQPSLGRVEVEHRTLQPNTHASFHIVSQRPHFPEAAPKESNYTVFCLLHVSIHT